MPEGSFYNLLIGFFAGATLFWGYARAKKGSFQSLGAAIISQAENAAEDKKRKAELEIREREFLSKKELEAHWQKEKASLASESAKLHEKEEKIETRLALIDKKYSEIEKKEAKLVAKEEKLDQKNEALLKAEEKWHQALKSLSGLTPQEAKKALEQELLASAQTEALKIRQRLVSEAKENGEKEARKILATSIGRLAVQAISEHTTATLPIPSPEIKGRIIGREGRNIRLLEQLTGVNFLIDDSPGEITLSSFNPIRRQIAKTALQDLIAEGRIHPTRIEEAVKAAEAKIERIIKEAGELAAQRAGVTQLHEEIIKLLGKLSFRTSLGQNVLEHSIEVSRLMGLMAQELGVNKKKAERIGLLHDIGKALTHEVSGSHALVGHDFVLKYGENADIANGIGCHHGEMEPLSIEASLCSAADTLSAARPGARVEAVDNYLTRIKNLEELAYEFPGVEKSYALQSGKEIRVVVFPDMVDDVGMFHLAKDLTQKIESRLEYPGKIKVTVIRERRAVEYAI
jgi:ribonuclease Y